MTENLSTREMVEHINSATKWRAFKAEKIQLAGPDAGQPVDVPFVRPEKVGDSVCTIIEYNPICDCGEEKMTIRSPEPWIEGTRLYGWGYTDTCYECAVVSSD